MVNYIHPNMIYMKKVIIDSLNGAKHNANCQFSKLSISYFGHDFVRMMNTLLQFNDSFNKLQAFIIRLSIQFFSSYPQRHIENNEQKTSKIERKLKEMRDFKKLKEIRDFKEQKETLSYLCRIFS
jgi:hypothetical protein